MSRARRLTLTFAAASALLGLIGWIDYATGYELALSLFYLIPVSIAAWHAGRLGGVVVAIAAGIVWAVVDACSGHHYSRWWLEYWNASIRFGFFLVTALCLASVKAALTEQTRLIRELSDTYADGWHIGGLFPICAVCGKVRNDADYLAQVKKFVEKHPHTRFVHGVCPDCLGSETKEPRSASSKIA
jgi:hypothetical protein